MAKSRTEDKDEQTAAERREEAAAERDPALSVLGMGTASGRPGDVATSGGPEQTPANAPRETRPTNAEPEEEDVPETLYVVATNTDNRVAIWERDAAHPKSLAYPDGGEIMVSGDGYPHEVGDTAAVRVALREGRLREMSRGKARAAQTRHHQERERRRGEALVALREQAELTRMEGSAISATRGGRD